jgi:Holliday junction resolvasome RuvABC endonuclease subunit
MQHSRPDWVFIEAPFVRGPVTRLTFGLAGVIEAAAARAGVPFSEAPPATVKKHITGSGKADKAAMMTAIRAMGFSPEDDNAADAIGVAHYAWHVKFGGGS